MTASDQDEVGTNDFNPLAMLDVPVSSTPAPSPAPTQTTAAAPTTSPAGPPQIQTDPSTPPDTPAQPTDPSTPPDTPAQPTDPVAAVAEDTVEDETTAVPAATPRRRLDVYARRKLKAALGVAVIVAGTYWVTTHGFPGQAPTISETAQAAIEDPKGLARNATPADPVTARMRQDQGQAIAHYQATGSYAGLQLSDKELRYVTSGHVFLASREADGLCYIYGVQGTQRTGIQVDATKVACTDAEMAATGQALAADEADLQQAAEGAARSGLEHAARTAAAYSRGIWRDGGPSLADLTGVIGTNTSVVANHGTWIVAEYRDANLCRRAPIGVDGTLGDLTRC